MRSWGAPGGPGSHHSRPVGPRPSSRSRTALIIGAGSLRVAAPLVTQPSPAPHGVWLSAAFFAVSGVLEIALALHDAPTPLPFTAAWQAAGAGLLHFLVAWGLWRRIAVCRSVAMVYCLAVVVT